MPVSLMEILHKEMKRFDETFGQIRTHKEKESFTYPLAQSMRVHLVTVGDPEQAGEIQDESLKTL